MPKGRRRLGLEAAARAMFSEDFDCRVLPFDEEAAIAYAEIFAARRQAGKPIAMADLIDCRHRFKPEGKCCHPQRCGFRLVQRHGHQSLEHEPQSVIVR